MRVNGVFSGSRVAVNEKSGGQFTPASLPRLSDFDSGFYCCWSSCVLEASGPAILDLMSRAAVTMKGVRSRVKSQARGPNRRRRGSLGSHSQVAARALRASSVTVMGNADGPFGVAVSTDRRNTLAKAFCRCLEG